MKDYTFPHNLRCNHSCMYLGSPYNIHLYILLYTLHCMLKSKYPYMMTSKCQNIPPNMFAYNHPSNYSRTLPYRLYNSPLLNLSKNLYILQNMCFDSHLYNSQHKKYYNCCHTRPNKYMYKNLGRNRHKILRILPNNYLHMFPYNYKRNNRSIPHDKYLWEKILLANSPKLNSNMI